MTRLLAPLFVLALAASACFGGDEAADAAPEASDEAAATGDDATAATADAGDGVDECGQGQAWPDDPDFREAVCFAFFQLTDLIGTEAGKDPQWSTRITDAMFLYVDDRDAALADLQAVTIEMQAAAG